MSKLTRVVFAALVLLLPAAGQSATPRDTLVVASNLDALITFDPAEVNQAPTNLILRNVCDPLVAYDQKDSSKIVPATAERWAVSPDGRTLSFTLRADLRFPSGKKATAHDAAWSLQRAVRLGLPPSSSLTQWGFTKEKRRLADSRSRRPHAGGDDGPRVPGGTDPVRRLHQLDDVHSRPRGRHQARQDSGRT